MMKKRLYKTVIPILVIAIAVAGIAGYAVYYYTSDSFMTLTGDSRTTVGLNGIYEDPGVTAYSHGKDVSEEVEVEGKVDTRTPGNYTVIYKSGNFTVKREVEVLDEMDPAIELKGDKNIKIKLGEAFKDPGFTATDSQGNDISADVKVKDVDIKRAGSRKIAYTVTDSAGKTTRVYRDIQVEPNTEYRTSGLPICMYHYVYDENNIPDDVNGNYISQKDLAEELAWLKDQDYYFPTWKEVRDYVDGKLLLPEKSIVLTFDDGAVSFLKNGIPLLEEYKTPATSFVITSKNGREKVEKYRSKYVTYESHSDNLHRGGGNIGHGGIFTVISHDDGLADLKKSIEIVGSKDAFAYPFGDTNDSCRQVVEDAGFLCAVTTVQGRAKPGDDPLLLPRQRMSRNQSMETFRAMVLPY